VASCAPFRPTAYERVQKLDLFALLGRFLTREKSTWCSSSIIQNFVNYLG
jgi:hypothetical protein